jgi:hypothetical protein
VSGSSIGKIVAGEVDVLLLVWLQIFSIQAAERAKDLL